jgi:hypothetical protein
MVFGPPSGQSLAKSSLNSQVAGTALGGTVANRPGAGKTVGRWAANTAVAVRQGGSCAPIGVIVVWAGWGTGVYRRGDPSGRPFRDKRHRAGTARQRPGHARSLPAAPSHIGWLAVKESG